MYEAVHAHPHGDATAARFARTAADYGFRGIVLRTRGETAADRGHGNRSAPRTERVQDATEIDVIEAVEVVADDPSTASGAIGNYRPDHTLILVRGGDDVMNRFAVEQEHVDVLTRPFADGGDVNHVLAKAARENGVRIEFDLGPVLRTEGGQRVRALRKLRKLREILDHYDAPVAVSANPTSHLQLRAPRELRAAGEAIGFDADAIETGLREWGEIAARNRERQSESFVAPGVRKGRYGDHQSGTPDSDDVPAGTEPSEESDSPEERDDSEGNPSAEASHDREADDVDGGERP
jgi:ribonuclease P/MRP protein subunit RPP1